jgi:hypothetical protein
MRRATRRIVLAWRMLGAVMSELGITCSAFSHQIRCFGWDTDGSSHSAPFASSLLAVEILPQGTYCWSRLSEFNTEYTEKSHREHRGLGGEDAG